jgi:hypothetical protein
LVLAGTELRQDSSTPQKVILGVRRFRNTRLLALYRHVLYFMKKDQG